MIHCPSCQQPVEITEQHYGTLFTCPLCSSVYFIDWNGQPEAPATVEENGQSTLTEEVTSSGYVLPEPAENPIEPIEEYVPTEFQPEPFVTSEEEPPSFESSPSLEPIVQSEEPAPETPEQAYDFGQTLDQFQTTSAPPPTPHDSGVSDSADFAEVTDFANSDTNTGPLSYSVTIEGIENSHIVNQLKEALTDSRFGWDVAELVAQIGFGRLILKGISPTVASVLVNRIKFLPLKISWRQDVLSSS